MNLLKKWHDFALKHFLLLNGILLLASFLCLLYLRGLKVDPDWLSLFDKKDPVFRIYLQHDAPTSNTHTLFIKIKAAHSETLEEVRNTIKDIPGVDRVFPLANSSGQSTTPWFGLTMKKKPPLTAYQRRDLLRVLRSTLEQMRIDYGITGAEVIFEEFNESLRNDFMRASVFALVLIGIIVSLFLGFSPKVVLGFVYQFMGLLGSLALYRLLYGSVNMLSVVIPVVLVGLGIDFVIHSLVTAQEASPSRHEYRGLQIYQMVLQPMLWSSLTTAGAFLFLLLAELPGLRSMGVMGFMGIMGMFLAVILFYPPAVSWLEIRKMRLGKGFQRRNPMINYSSLLLPKSLAGQRLVSGFVFACCLILAAFAFRVTMKDQIDGVYSVGLRSLQLQLELSRQIEAYPSLLFLSFESDDPMAAVKRLLRLSDDLIIDPHSIRLESENSRVYLQLMARSNPFDSGNLASLREKITQQMEGREAEGLVLTGDAVLNMHMNDLLLGGMKSAFLAVFVLLAGTLVLMFRNVRFLIAPLSVLALSVIVILGCLGLLRIPLSAYNLPLFPLFIGIGVDDCLYVAYAIRRAGSIGSSVIRGISMTTITTMIGYGSLITASNTGFVTMGKTAVLGLGLVFLCAFYLLPLLLKPLPKESRFF